MGAYFRTTRTKTYGFLAALPLLLTYELLMVIASSGGGRQLHVGAYVLVKKLLFTVGAAGNLTLGLIVGAIGVAIYMSERQQKLGFQPTYFMGMALESVLYAVVFPFIISRGMGAVAPGMWAYPLAEGSQAVAEAGVTLQLALSLGAGLYEELIFRVLLFGGLVWFFKHHTTSRGVVLVLAALGSSLIFSGIHYLGPLGDSFAWGSFVYRFLLGMVLAGLYVSRGFGIAAWTHAIYDIMVLMVLRPPG